MLQFPRPPFCEDPRCCYPLITIHSGSNHDGYWALLLYILPAIAASESYTISGYVVDGLTSQALPGVKVMLFNALGDSASGPFVNGPSASPTVTDTHEHFVFTALPANRYALQAATTRDIYTFREGEGWLQETPIYVGPHTREQSIIFHILPRTTLRGTVRDETGELQDKGAVVLYQHVRNGGRFEVVRAGQALVDDRGRYVFADLTPGYYVVCAEPASQPSASGESVVKYEPEVQPRANIRNCYPAASSAGPWFQLSPGANATRQLRLQPLGALTVRVIDQTGIVVEGAQAKISSFDDERTSHMAGYATISADGYRSLLTRGEYKVIVATAGSGNLLRARKQTFPPTYFPATTDLNRAALITVVPGKEVVATVQVTPTPAYEVRGK